MGWINVCASMIRKLGLVGMVIVGGGVELVIEQLPDSYQGPARLILCLIVLVVLIRYLHGMDQKPDSRIQ